MDLKILNQIQVPNSEYVFRKDIYNPTAYSIEHNDEFGASVATYGQYSIASAPGEDEAGGLGSGKAYILNNMTGTVVHRLDNPNAYDTPADDQFGFKVAICDSYSAVSAPGEDDASGTTSGKAYIFDNKKGGLLHTLDNPNAYDTSQNDWFGYSIAICEQYCIVGAYYEDDAGGNSSGKAYIFSTSTGNLLHTLDNPNDYGTSVSDYFGYSVAICESYSVVGASWEDDAGGSSSGKVYVFDNSTGLLIRTLDNPNPYSTSAYDSFGGSVSTCETYCVVGAYGEGEDGSGSSGKVYIFENTTGTLLHTLDNPNAYGTPSLDEFGKHVSISDLYTIVGTYKEDDASGDGSGKAYIFDNITGNLLIVLDNPNVYGTSEGDAFGYSTGISNSYAIVGAYNEDTTGYFASGMVYIYDLSEYASPKILDNPNAYDLHTSDFFGNSVATSESYSIVGANGEDDASGNESGKAYIFNNSTGDLLWTIDNPNAYGTSGYDNFGGSVSICESYSIIGASGESDAGGAASGKAYIINNNTGKLLHTLDNPNAYGVSGEDYFGSSVSICESYSIVGANAESDASGFASGKAYIFNNSTGTLLWTLDNPNPYSTSEYDAFGQSVSICESYSLVGTPYEGDVGGDNSGKAYIFNNSTGTLLWTLDNPNPYGTSASDNFGGSVSICESYSIVGATYEDDAGGENSGKAYIYDNATGNLLHTLDNPNAYDVSAFDEFGFSVSITESYCLVGAKSEDDIDGASSGKAYVFSSGTGELLHTFDNPNAYDTSASDVFGSSVSISDSHMIVGAQYEDHEGDWSASGKAYLYRLNDIVPTVLDNPSGYGTPSGDEFGTSVATFGSLSIVGAPYEDDAGGGTQSGKAYIFNNRTGCLLHTLDNPNAYDVSAGDYFGYSVAICESYSAVGAYYETDASSSTASGVVYIFNNSTGDLLWTLDNLSIYDTGAYDYFGYSVAISETYCVVGAYGEDNAEKVYVFRNSTGQLLYFLSSPNHGDTVNDLFGRSVAVSELYIIVGAKGEDEPSNAASGKAYIFQSSTGMPLWTLDNPNAYDTAASDFFGASVDITDTLCVVGAVGEDDANGLNSGKAYIFENSTGTLLHTLDNPNTYGTSTDDNFGISVSISDNYCVVGSHNEDDAGGISSGKAYVFSTVTGELLHTIDNPNAYDTSASDFFGISVSISDSYCIVGAPLEDDAGGSSSGKAYIFNKNLFDS